jgi:predicted ArsR family transcriptional regulator
MGRPAARYKLTVAGDHLFPKHYDALAVAVIEAVSDDLGADAARRVLARITDARVAATAPLIRDLPMAEKVQALRQWYLENDPYLDVEETPDGFRIIERNCPYYNVAMERPELCSVSVNAFTRLLGARVVREEAFQRGGVRCVFRVFTGEPVTSDEFELESESATRSKPS